MSRNTGLWGIMMSENRLAPVFMEGTIWGKRQPTQWVTLKRWNCYYVRTIWRNIQRKSDLTWRSREGPLRKWECVKNWRTRKNWLAKGGKESIPDRGKSIWLTPWCLRGWKILSVARGVTHKRMRAAEGEGANPENPANWSQKPWAECSLAERLPRG